MRILVTIAYIVTIAVACSLAKGKLRQCNDVLYSNIDNIGPQLHLEMLENAFDDEVLTGTCSVQGSIIPPHVSVVVEDRTNCKLDITSKERAPGLCTHFALKHIVGNCTIKCFIGRSKIVKTVTPTANGMLS